MRWFPELGVAGEEQGVLEGGAGEPGVSLWTFKESVNHPSGRHLIGRWIFGAEAQWRVWAGAGSCKFSGRGWTGGAAALESSRGDMRRLM